MSELPRRIWAAKVSDKLEIADIADGIFYDEDTPYTTQFVHVDDFDTMEDERDAMREALGNMVSLASWHFTDEAQIIAYQNARAAIEQTGDAVEEGRRC